MHQAKQRRTIGFFEDKKFNSHGVLERLKEYGFLPDNYKKVIVSWGWDVAAGQAAAAADIELWDFRHITKDIAEKTTGKSEYFSDDTLRTLNLFIHAQKELKWSC